MRMKKYWRLFYQPLCLHTSGYNVRQNGYGGKRMIRRVEKYIILAALSIVLCGCGENIDNIVGVKIDENKVKRMNEGIQDVQPADEGTVNSDGWLNHLVPGVYKRSSENCITTVTIRYNEAGEYTIEIVNDITGNNSTGRTTIIDEIYSVFDDLGQAYGVGRSPDTAHQTILSTSVIDVSTIETNGCGYIYTPETGEIMMHIASLLGGDLYLFMSSGGEASVINQTGSNEAVQFMEGYFNEVTDIPY